MILRLEPTHGTAIDLALATVERSTLFRRPDGCYAEVEDADALPLRRALAYAGIEAREVAIALGPGNATPATANDLIPAPRGLLISDMVRVRRVPLGPAAKQALRRPFAGWRPPSPSARARCRALLTGREALLAWDRRAWFERARVREIRTRSTLRPVVFDRGALEGAGPERRVFASEGALAGWAFG